MQLLLGRFPSAALVQQYQLQQYQPLMQAMRTGDMRLFDTTMDVQQFTFIQEVCIQWLSCSWVWGEARNRRCCHFTLCGVLGCGGEATDVSLVCRSAAPVACFPQGTYLLLEKLRLAVLRRLLKQVCRRLPLVVDMDLFGWCAFHPVTADACFHDCP